eukprot:scaffold2510_cov169-Amphora_coffeaeformis.AAC.49
MVEGNPGTTVSDIGKAEDGAISWWGEPGASMERNEQRLLSLTYCKQKTLARDKLPAPVSCIENNNNFVKDAIGVSSRLSLPLGKYVGEESVRQVR